MQRKVGSRRTLYSSASSLIREAKPELEKDARIKRNILVWSHTNKTQVLQNGGRRGSTVPSRRGRRYKRRLSYQITVAPGKNSTVFMVYSYTMY